MKVLSVPVQLTAIRIAIAIVCLLECTTDTDALQIQIQTTQNHHHRRRRIRMANTPDSSHSHSHSHSQAIVLDRRKWMRNAICLTTFGILNTRTATLPANAADNNDNDENENEYDYDNPNMPEAPEERSGLVVLRVAEVCNFQEKILRAVAEKAIDTSISPQQIVFGTKLLLKNSNIAGNMQLMIDTEIPKTKRNAARQNAARTMNTIQSISTTSAKIQRPFTDEEMVLVADLYRDARLQLNAMYEYLPQDGKDKYYGYFMKVTEYEKKIAEGVYNPELDGILKLDY